jgi:putative transposase
VKGKRATEQHIIGVLKKSEAGAATKELCRRHGISEQTFYRWKAKFGGMEVSDAKKLRGLEDARTPLRRMSTVRLERRFSTASDAWSRRVAC